MALQPEARPAQGDDIAAMMRDRDPSFVARVTAGFQKMYGE